jgi:hypothetical protein
MEMVKNVSPEWILHETPNSFTFVPQSILCV